MQFLKELGLSESDNKGCYNGSWTGGGSVLLSHSPSSGEPIATITQATLDDLESCMAAMEGAKKAWGEMPAPARGEIVRQIGTAMRAKRDALGALVSLEMGKIASEGIGEVQEFIGASPGGADARECASIHPLRGSQTFATSLSA